MSVFDKNMIRLARVSHATNSAKVFLQQSLAIVEENGQLHQEDLCKVVSLEVKVAK